MHIVKTGIQDDEFIQILSGLNDSMEVVKGPYSAVSRLIDEGSYMVKDGVSESSGMTFSISTQ